MSFLGGGDSPLIAHERTFHIFSVDINFRPTSTSYVMLCMVSFSPSFPCLPGHIACNWSSRCGIRHVWSYTSQLPLRSPSLPGGSVVREIRSNGKDMSIECGEHVRINSFFCRFSAHHPMLIYSSRGKQWRPSWRRLWYVRNWLRKKKKEKESFHTTSFYSHWIGLLYYAIPTVSTMAKGDWRRAHVGLYTGDCKK